MLRAKLCYWAIGLFPIASPGVLRINEKTSVLFGPVYARKLLFTKDSESPETPGVIEASLFGDGFEGNDKRGGLAAEAIGEIPHFPALGGKVRAYYENGASSNESRLKNGSRLDGRTQVPRDSRLPVYFCEGDLHLGAAIPFEAAGQLLVYVKGNLFIHRSMQGLGDSWASFLVEKDIILESSDPTNQLQLRGNFIANGALRWKGSKPDPRTFGLSCTGSLLLGQGLDAITAGIEKKFIRWQVEDSLLPLPRFTQLLETRVENGKYRR